MSDNCCTLCRGPHGICMSRYGCEHHKIAQAQDDANHQARRTVRDPTGDTAVWRAMQGGRGRPSD